LWGENFSGLRVREKETELAQDSSKKAFVKNGTSRNSHTFRTEIIVGERGKK